MSDSGESLYIETAFLHSLVIGAETGSQGLPASGGGESKRDHNEEGGEISTNVNESTSWSSAG
jgi:hypothetical protein